MREPVPADERRRVGATSALRRAESRFGNTTRGDFGGTMSGRAEALQRFAPRAHR